METSVVIDVEEIQQQDFPNEGQMDKISMADVSLENSRDVKNTLWLIDSYIHPDVAPWPLIINCEQTFINIHIGNFECLNQETFVEFLHKIGENATFLKITDADLHYDYYNSDILQCFPKLEYLEIETIDDFLDYDWIPPTLKMIKLRLAPLKLTRQVHEKLKGLKHFQALYSGRIYFVENNSIENTEQLVNFSNRIKDITKWIPNQQISTRKSLWNTTIDSINITKMSLSYTNRQRTFKLPKPISLCKNLEELSVTLCKPDIDCFQFHDLFVPNLKSFELYHNNSSDFLVSGEWELYSEFKCQKCLETIMRNFLNVQKVALSVILSYENLESFIETHKFITDFTFNMAGEPLDHIRFFSKLTHLKKLRMTTSNCFFTISDIELWPEMPHLEDLGTCELRFTPTDCNSYPQNWTESAFVKLARKCPNIKKFECYFLNRDINNHDVFALMNIWPGLEKLKVNLRRTTTFDKVEFLDFLQRQKQQGWNPPPLKKFRSFNISSDQASDWDRIHLFFEIFPTLKFVEYGDAMFSYAQYQEKKFNNRSQV